MNDPYLELFESVGSANTTRRKIEILKDITRLGRERGLEVEIALEAANVSRRHAEIRKQDNSFVLVDLGSFNGTFLNGRRIAGAEILNDKDVIQLGPAGPSLRYRASAPAYVPRAAQPIEPVITPSGRLTPQIKHQTIVARAESGPLQDTFRSKHVNPNEPQIFLQRPFDKSQLVIGRDDSCDTQS